MANSFRKSLMYRAATRWSSAFMRSQPNKSTGPLDRSQLEPLNPLAHIGKKGCRADSVNPTVIEG
jgi:hypothetical protein